MKAKNIGLGLLAVLLIAGLSNAGSIKTWTTETLTASDLNATFQHIHNNMVGGHGARLVNADVSSSAAIAHSKLATPALLPKAMASVAPDCSSATCTLAMNSGFSQIQRTGAGEYTATLLTARENTVYGVGITPYDSTGIRMCRLTSITSTSAFTFSCYDAASASDTGFTIIVWDNND